MVQDEVYSTIKLKQGSNYILPTKIELEGYTFNGFEINGEKVEILRNIQNDMTISANMVFEKSIKEAEFYILKNLDLISGSFENFEELSEYDFYKELYSNIFKDYAEYEIEYYKISLVEMLRLNVTEDSTFTDYLQEMCKYIIKK